MADLDHVSEASLNDLAFIDPNGNDPRPKFRQLLRKASKLRTLTFQNESSRLKLSIWAEIFDYLKECPTLQTVHVDKHKYLLAPPPFREEPSSMSPKRESDTIQFETWWSQEDVDLVIELAQRNPEPTFVSFRPLLPSKEIGWVYEAFQACPNVYVTFDNAVEEIKWEELDLPPELELTYKPLYTYENYNLKLLEQMKGANVVNMFARYRKSVHLLYPLTSLRHVTWSSSEFKQEHIDFALYFLQIDDGQIRSFQRSEYGSKSYHYESLPQKTGHFLLRTKDGEVELNALELNRHLNAKFERNSLSLHDLLYPEAVSSLLAKTESSLELFVNVDKVELGQLAAWSEMLKTVPIKIYRMYRWGGCHPARFLNLILPALMQNPHIERAEVPLSQVLSPYPLRKPIEVEIDVGFDAEDVAAVVALAHKFPVTFNFRATAFPPLYKPILDLQRDCRVSKWSPTWKGMPLGSVVKAVILFSTARLLLPVANKLTHLRQVEVHLDDDCPRGDFCKLLPRLPKLQEITFMSTNKNELTDDVAKCFLNCANLTSLPSPARLPDFGMYCFQKEYLPRHLKSISVKKPGTYESHFLLYMAMDQLELSELEEVEVSPLSLGDLVPELLHNVVRLVICAQADEKYLPRRGKYKDYPPQKLLRTALKMLPHVHTLCVHLFEPEDVEEVLRENLQITAVYHAKAAKEYSYMPVTESGLPELCHRNVLRHKTLLDCCYPEFG